MITKFKKLLTFGALLTLIFGMSGCAEEEQDRILKYEKGVYLGKKDQNLTPEQLQRLNLRSNGQRVY
jgi:hypothetical protein